MAKTLDLRGKKFGKWTVLEKAENTSAGKVTWLCECECGTKRKVVGSQLVNGNSTSCGCDRKRSTIDLTGQRFGRLVVIKQAPKRTYSKQAFWECQCDCGNKTITSGQSLRNGQSKSCGCYSHELRVHDSTSHGDSGTRLYTIWLNMKDRTLRKTCRSYKDYGARGIKVCDAWLKSYECFKEWALANGYQNDLSIDRIDVNGDYCPENCRWANALVQANNTRKNKRITYQGESHTFSEWARITGLSPNIIRGRYNLGWEVEEILNTPKMRKGEKKRK